MANDASKPKMQKTAGKPEDSPGRLNPRPHLHKLAVMKKVPILNKLSDTESRNNLGKPHYTVPHIELIDGEECV
uniref:Small kinetochore-associated protein n=1 Tax=Ascaris lumbricoides TaxID=6252 RepID=A0A0M3HY80_ASCLU